MSKTIILALLALGLISCSGLTRIHIYNDFEEDVELIQKYSKKDGLRITELTRNSASKLSIDSTYKVTIEVRSSAGTYCYSIPSLQKLDAIWFESKFNGPHFYFLLNENLNFYLLKPPGEKHSFYNNVVPEQPSGFPVKSKTCESKGV